MIVVVDPGMGNLRSVDKAFEHLGYASTVTSDPETLAAAERVVLPGVGAFGDCVDNLASAGLDVALRSVIDLGRPVLGICLGLQVLFDESEEFGPRSGLGVVPGRVLRLSDELIVPHMGWNSVHVTREHPVLGRDRDGDHFYFVHSYVVAPDDPLVALATTDYGGSFVSAIARDNLVAVQFHPEKSQQAGLRLLDAFARWSP